MIKDKGVFGSPSEEAAAAGIAVAGTVAAGTAARARLARTPLEVVAAEVPARIRLGAVGALADRSPAKRSRGERGQNRRSVTLLIHNPQQRGGRSVDRHGVNRIVPLNIGSFDFVPHCSTLFPSMLT